MLPAADRRTVPWKNGGGLTREIAAHPPGSDLDSFDWRLSIAEVRTAGAFSSFPGIDRHMALLAGRLSLSIAAAAPVVLSAESAPLSFAGDVAVHAEPLAGTVTDLNLMVRRERARGRLVRCVVAGSQRLALSATSTVVIALTELTVSTAAGRARLAAQDAVRLDGVAACELHAKDGARAYLAEIWAEPP
jgi:uncharacterized protein